MRSLFPEAEVTRSLSRNNLVKQFNMVESEEARLIDTNELIRRRRENAAPRREQQASEDGFVSGLGAEEVELSPEDVLAQNTVIKAHEDVQALLAQAQKDAQAMLEQAQKEAAGLLEDARAQAEREKTGILDAARQQGYEAGQAKARAEADAAKKEYQQKKHQLETEYSQLLDELEPKFVDTITSVYEHIFQVDLSSSREILNHLITRTMHELEGGGNFLIHVSKEDYTYVAMQKKQLFAGIPSGIGTVEVVEDMTLGKNECLIETDGGIFDCSLGTQLAGLKQKLMLLAWSGEE